MNAIRKSLLEILTWPEYFKQKGITKDMTPDAQGVVSFSPEINEKVSLWQGDITQLEVDAIVKTKNDGEIAALGGCPEGEARILEGLNLPAKYVIHTVGPSSERKEILESTYKSCFNISIANSIKSIAFPCISSGVCGFSREEAAHVALRTTRQFLESNEEQISRVVFVPSVDEDVKIYERLMQRYFPLKYETLITEEYIKSIISS